MKFASLNASDCIKKPYKDHLAKQNVQWSQILWKNSTNFLLGLQNNFLPAVLHHTYLGRRCPGRGSAAARPTLCCSQPCSLRAELLLTVLHRSGNMRGGEQELIWAMCKDFCVFCAFMIITRSPFLWAAVLWDKVSRKPVLSWAASFFLYRRWAWSFVTQM